MIEHNGIPEADCTNKPVHVMGLWEELNTRLGELEKIDHKTYVRILHRLKIDTLCALEVAHHPERHATPPRTDFSVRFSELCEQLHDTYVAKNTAYGDAFGQTIIKYGLIAALVRMTDKYSRIVALRAGTKNDVRDESLRDTLLDLANYAIMTMIPPRCSADHRAAVHQIMCNCVMTASPTKGEQLDIAWSHAEDLLQSYNTAGSLLGSRTLMRLAREAISLAVELESQ